MAKIYARTKQEQDKCDIIMVLINQAQELLCKLKETLNSDNCPDYTLAYYDDVIGALIEVNNKIHKAGG